MVRDGGRHRGPPIKHKQVVPKLSKAQQQEVRRQERAAAADKARMAALQRREKESNQALRNAATRVRASGTQMLFSESDESEEEMAPAPVLDDALALDDDSSGDEAPGAPAPAKRVPVPVEVSMVSPSKSVASGVIKRAIAARGKVDKKAAKAEKKAAKDAAKKAKKEALRAKRREEDALAEAKAKKEAAKKEQRKKEKKEKETVVKAKDLRKKKEVEGGGGSDTSDWMTSGDEMVASDAEVPIIASKKKSADSSSESSESSGSESGSGEDRPKTGADSSRETSSGWESSDVEEDLARAGLTAKALAKKHASGKSLFGDDDLGKEAGGVKGWLDGSGSEEEGDLADKFRVREEFTGKAGRDIMRLQKAIGQDPRFRISADFAPTKEEINASGHQFEDVDDELERMKLMEETKEKKMKSWQTAKRFDPTAVDEDLLMGGDKKAHMAASSSESSSESSGGNSGDSSSETDSSDESSDEFGGAGKSGDEEESEISKRRAALETIPDIDKNREKTWKVTGWPGGAKNGLRTAADSEKGFSLSSIISIDNETEAAAPSGSGFSLASIVPDVVGNLDAAASTSSALMSGLNIPSVSMSTIKAGESRILKMSSDNAFVFGGSAASSSHVGVKKKSSSKGTIQTNNNSATFMLPTSEVTQTAVSVKVAAFETSVSIMGILSQAASSIHSLPGGAGPRAAAIRQPMSKHDLEGAEAIAKIGGLATLKDPYQSQQRFDDLRSHIRETVLDQYQKAIRKAKKATKSHTSSLLERSALPSRKKK